MDERYTSNYIEREASIIIFFFSPHIRKRPNTGRLYSFNEMDYRIMKRYGVK
jgi:hypothetical protein